MGDLIGSAEYSNRLPALEQGEWANADIWNARYQRLLDNDAYLEEKRKEIDQKIAELDTALNHVNALRATLEAYGLVKLTDSAAVTDSTGLALAATEKNASIEGTLANLFSKLNTDLPHMFSNPNLLINPDFKINQRGQSEYSGHLIYTADRWEMAQYSGPGTSVDISGNGLVAHPLSGAPCRILQHIEYPIEPDTPYTITISTSNGTDSFTFINKNEGGYMFNFDVIGYFAANAIIFDCYCDITIYWAKLELGSKATPFIPPDPATELMKCQRYYWSNTNDTSDRAIGAILAHAMGVNKDWMPMGFLFPTVMRAVPTVLIKDVAYVNVSNVNVADGVIASGITSSGIATLRSLTSSFLGDYDAYVRLSADAEIY